MEHEAYPARDLRQITAGSFDALLHRAREPDDDHLAARERWRSMPALAPAWSATCGQQDRAAQDGQDHPGTGGPDSLARAQRHSESHAQRHEPGHLSQRPCLRPVAVSGRGRPEDLRDVIRFTQQHRTAAGPFDVALEGRTDGATPARGAKHLAPTCRPG
jgi:hypothetical protein